MKPQGILFKGEMVRAILANRKTQTRRIVKGALNECPGEWEYKCQSTNGTFLFHHVRDGKQEAHYFKCPYPVGTRLYVKETHYITEVEPIIIDGQAVASGGEPDVLYAADNPDQASPWRPSIFMPRWASRIDLEVTNVRCQRLQSITEEDAIAEGMDARIPYGDSPCEYLNDSKAICDYASLWENINGDGSWNANPWVWAISFRRLSL